MTSNLGYNETVEALSTRVKREMDKTFWSEN